MNSKTLSIILVILLAVAAILAGVFYSKNSEFEERVAMLDDEIASLKRTAQLVPGLEERNRKLEENLALSDEKVEVLNTEITRLRTIVKSDQGLREQVRKLEEEVARAGEKAASEQVDAGIEEKNREIGGLKESIAKLQSDNDDLKKQIESFPAKTAAAEPAPEEADSTVVPDAQALKTQPAGKDAELAELKSDRVALSTEVGRLQAMVAELETAGRASGDRIGGLQAELNRLKEELAAAELRSKRVAADLTGLMQAHDSLVADLKSQIEGREITIEQMKNELTVTVVDGILFRSGSSSITPRGRETLAKVGESLKGLEGKKIRVIGHSDDVPISPEWSRVFPSNWELSAARAVSVARLLVENSGLDPAMVEPSGRSFYDPAADNESEEGRARNRRVEIVIAPILVE